MKPEITKSSWDDMIFESRNKEYGAYPIRKSYNDNITKGFFVAILFGAFAFGAIQVASLLHLKIEIAPPIIKIPRVVLPPQIIPDQPAVKQQVRSQPKSKPDFFPVATTQQPVEAPPVEPINPSTNSSPVGTENSTAQFPTDGNAEGGDAERAAVAVKPVEIFTSAEVMPEYEGGLAAMSRFLSRQLRYPASERSVGHEGTVYVRFVVNSAGQVVDVEAVRGVSGLLDKEAMRVVSLMKKWKPGAQHGIAVNVRMILPIKFQLEQ